jgi:hypothetical protein
LDDSTEPINVCSGAGKAASWAASARSDPARWRVR